MAGIMPLTIVGGPSEWRTTFTSVSITSSKWLTEYGTTAASPVANPFIPLLGVNCDHIRGTASSNIRGLRLGVEGIVPNEGWTQLTVDGTNYLRTNATYETQAEPPQTTWKWSALASAPFGASQANIEVIMK